MNYYNGLKQKDHDKELIIQKEEEIELTRYRELKSKKKVLEKEISATAGVKVGPFVRKKQSNPAEITKKRKVDGNYGGVLKETADADFGGVNPDRTTVISSGNTFTDSQNSILKLTSSKPNTKGIDYKSHPKESISQQTPLVSGYSSSDESSS